MGLCGGGGGHRTPRPKRRFQKHLRVQPALLRFRRDGLRRAGSRFSYLDKIRSASPRIEAPLAHCMTPNPKPRAELRLDGCLS